MTFWEAVRKQDYRWGCSYVCTDSTEKWVWAKGWRGRERCSRQEEAPHKVRETQSGTQLERKLVLVGSRHAGVVKDLTSHFLEE